MNVRSIWILVVLAASALAGCAASTPVKVDSQAMSGIRTVAIVKAPEPREYTVINKGSLTAAMGAVGGAAIALEAQKNQKGFLGALARTKFSFADQLTADLEAALQARGYKTRVVAVQRGEPHKLLGDYASMTTPDVDAVLDVATKGVGYATQHWMNSAFWRPEAYVQVGLYARGGAPVYEETFMYGYHNPLMSATDLNAPEAYRFANKEAMEAASDNTLVDGLKDASRAIATHVAAKLAQ